MDFQRAPLPHEIQYSLDCMTEEHTIDASTYFALQLFGDRAMITATIENMRPLSRGWRERMGAALTMQADEIIARLPADLRGEIICREIAALPSRIKDIAETLAGWAAVDAVVGGCMEPFRRRQRLRPDGSIEKRIQRRITSPAFIRRYVKASPDAARVRVLAKKTIRRCAGVDIARSVNGDKLEAIWQAQRNAETELIRRNIGKIDAGKQTAASKETKRRRKVLRRAAVIAAGVLGAQSVGALARGEAISIQGEAANLVLQSNGNLAATGHGGLRVSLAAPGGEEIAKLCIFIGDTPALDQAVGLALHFQAGLEQEVVDAANLISVTDAGRSNPLITGRASKQQNRIAFDAANPQVVSGFPPDSWRRDRIIRENYWAQTKDIWVEAVGVQVLSARWATRWKAALNG